MTTTPTSTNNKTTKVKRLREDRFCLFAFLLFRFCFVVGLFFNVFFKLKKFFITKNLVIIFKIITIKSFYNTYGNFAIILVF